ncbi:MAG: efflux RND transporter permease subunit [Hahellaceae bacterium]|nr:efflux RND transporter permease subunit [Hahellaceae bacterium]
MSRPTHSSGIAAWSVAHPVGVVMIALTVVVLGGFAVGRLAIDLLPHIIYPEIRVRVIDAGVPATVMEDRVTRQLEEQLSITEDVIRVQSSTSQGSATVDLTFSYDKDIDQALQEASIRLERAKRFLPASSDAPTIFKRDPSQIPVMEFVVTSSLRDPMELRAWTDDVLRKWFLNLPGVAAAEVGGGLAREIQVLPDQQRLAGVGLTLTGLISALQRDNRDDPIGRYANSGKEWVGRISGRFNSVEDIARLPLPLKDGSTINLDEVATVLDTHEDEQIRIRANGVSGVKLSIQKQPRANTVEVVEVVRERLQWLARHDQLPEDISINPISDQSVFVRQALSNTSLAALSGALLSMAVVYLFLGSVRRTLIIGTAIPLAIMVTFVLMGLGGLTLNIMTLGGLALGVGMLVDNTIVMMENIYRHQMQSQPQSNTTLAARSAASEAASEVSSAVIASTSTNLAAVLPFLFVGGLVGLLFQELIVTISAAILASLVIALTLVPALAGQVGASNRTGDSRLAGWVNRVLKHAQQGLGTVIVASLQWRWMVLAAFSGALAWSVWQLGGFQESFLPRMDDGQVRVRIVTDPGTTVEEVDQVVARIESQFSSQPAVSMVSSFIGGSVFGRSERVISNQASLNIQLIPLAQRGVSTQAWIAEQMKQINAMRLAGVTVRMSPQGIRGLRTSLGDDDLSLRIQGEDLEQLDRLGRTLVAHLRPIPGLRNLTWSSEEKHQELSIRFDRERVSALGLDLQEIAANLRVALNGVVVTDYLEGDRQYDVRVRLPASDLAQLEDLESILLFPADKANVPVYLGTVAQIELIRSPSSIMRDNQMRSVEISASLADNAALSEVLNTVDERLASFPLPEGYSVHDGGARESLQKGQTMTRTLLGLAMFLVFVVMAVQYEALLNPLVILLSVPFALIGVVAGLQVSGLSLSMPVWLGMIMLAGIVVNNAIVLVEYIEILRHQGEVLEVAIKDAARLRLRPILMTTLTTVVGMAPLALGWGEGAEMLQPLAVTIVYGLSFGTLVSLLLIPVIYRILHRT